MNNTVYTVTVVDIYTDTVVGIRRTPAIFTDLHTAIFTVKNNVQDVSDGGTFQYAAIEETQLNYIRPSVDSPRRCWWFKYNSATDEFIQDIAPHALRNQSGFGIG
jgi:hypothetical protein